MIVFYMVILLKMVCLITGKIWHFHVGFKMVYQSFHSGYAVQNHTKDQKKTNFKQNIKSRQILGSHCVINTCSNPFFPVRNN